MSSASDELEVYAINDPELLKILAAYTLTDTDADSPPARESLLSTLRSAGYTALAEWLLLNPEALENWAGDEADVERWMSSIHNDWVRRRTHHQPVIITRYSVRYWRERIRHSAAARGLYRHTCKVELSTTRKSELPLCGYATSARSDNYKIGGTLATLRALVEYVSRYGAVAKVERTETELVLRFPARWAEKSEVKNEQ